MINQEFINSIFLKHGINVYLQKEGFFQNETDQCKVTLIRALQPSLRLEETTKIIIRQLKEQAVVLAIDSKYNLIKEQNNKIKRIPTNAYFNNENEKIEVALERLDLNVLQLRCLAEFFVEQMKVIKRL